MPFASMPSMCGFHEKQVSSLPWESVLHSVECQQLRLWHVFEIQTIVSDAEYHTLIQQEQMMLFGAYTALVFSTQPFLHLSFVDLACVLYVSILSRWILRNLFMWSMISPLTETAGIDGPTALFLRVHHRACALLDWFGTVSWHNCDTSFQLLLDSSDCCVGVTGCFVDKPMVCKCKHLS